MECCLLLSSRCKKNRDAVLLCCGVLLIPAGLATIGTKLGEAISFLIPLDGVDRGNGSTTYNYVYNGCQLVQMTKGSDTLYFTYGAIGPTTVTWNGTTYYYAVNAQGDVMGIFDGSGNCVVTYNWDNAWGYNPEPEGSLADTLGTLNPLRYRSYVYDEETEL